jgi:hypothetical protein
MALNRSISRTEVNNNANEALKIFKKLTINQKTEVAFMGLLDHEERINSQEERLAFLEKEYKKAIASPAVNAKEVKAKSSPPVHTKEVKPVPCKYAEKCTKLNCTFIHPSKKVKDITNELCVFNLANKCKKGNKCEYKH